MRSYLLPPDVRVLCTFAQARNLEEAAQSEQHTAGDGDLTVALGATRGTMPSASNDMLRQLGRLAASRAEQTVAALEALSAGKVARGRAGIRWMASMMVTFLVISAQVPRMATSQSKCRER